jgi:WD40 repeat protein
MRAIIRNIRSSFIFDTPSEVLKSREELQSSSLRLDIDKRCGDSDSRQPLLRLLKEREIGQTKDQTLSKHCLSSTLLVPNSCIQELTSDRSERVYNVTFSKSGRICVAAWQDESVRVYIERPGLQIEKSEKDIPVSSRNKWHESARVQARNVAWTVTSVDISPDESAIAYSSITSEVHVLRLDLLKRFIEGNNEVNDNDNEEEEEMRHVTTSHYSSATTPKLPTSPISTGVHSDLASRSFSGASATSSSSSAASGSRYEHGVESHVSVDFTKEDEGANHSNQSSSSAAERRRGYRYGFGIFSIKFSVGGSELVAGCNDGYIRIMDLSRALVSDKVAAHKDDINSVCFAGGSGEAADVVISGSDEVGTPLKVWDRRLLTKPVSVLLGHQSGITHVSPRGDGHTILSVSKDQTIKIWDLRKSVYKCFCFCFIFFFTLETF